MLFIATNKLFIERIKVWVKLYLFFIFIFLQLFECINNYSSTSELRYVGGCIRKILNEVEIDDIDLATNLNPEEVKK